MSDLVCFLSADCQFLKLEKTCDLTFLLLSQILLKIKWNKINTEKYFLFSNNNYFKV